MSLREEIRVLTTKELVLYGIISVALISFVWWDISGDIAAGNSLLHICIDIFFGASALLAMILLAARVGRLRILSERLLDRSKREKAVVVAEVSEWKWRTEQLQAGVSEEIDRRMEKWRLSEAEKEIGLLLLKGLSLREIGEIRGTAERTVRQQSLSIYSKADVAGRAELSAYFMEDFLDRKNLSDSTVGADSHAP